MVSGGGGYNIKARQRLPTLYEVLHRRTQSPVDLWSFYVFMREQYRGVDYLDFWLDVVQHLSLCRHYVRGLRQSIMAGSERTNNSSRTSSVLLDTLVQEGGLNDADSQRLSAFLRGDAAQGEQGEKNAQALYRLSALLDAMNSKEQDIAEMHSPATRGDNFISRVNANTAEQERKGHNGDSEVYDEKDRTPVAPGPSSGFQGPAARDSDANSYYSTHSQHLQNFSRPHTQNSEQLQQEIRQQTPQQSPRRQELSQLQQEQGLSFNAETIERLFPRRQDDIDDGNSYVTRQDIRQSSHRILVTYFIPGAEREIVLPPRIMKSVKQAIEVEGRDDPEVFDEAREYVFQAMEREAFPAFLSSRALGNITPVGSLARMIVGLVSIFAAFWVGFILIFLDWKPKVTRLWLILPFAFAAYGIFASLYNLDPLMAIMGYSEAPASKSLVRIREPYVRQLLVKRSVFVLAVVVLVAAIFVIIFALVPGKRL